MQFSSGGKEDGFGSGVAGQKNLNQGPLKIQLDASLAICVPSCHFHAYSQESFVDYLL